MPDLLYIDTSAFLRRVFDDGAELVDTITGSYLDRGGAVTSGRLLWLEARRAGVREHLLGNTYCATTSGRSSRRTSTR